MRLRRLMTQKKNQMGLDPNVSRQRRLEIMMESAILDLAISVKRTIVEPGWWKPKEQISKYPLDNFQMKVV
jgi:hypothetical protein